MATTTSPSLTPRQHSRSHSRSHSAAPPPPFASSSTSSPSTTSPFEQQRQELVGEIAASLEQVLQNINRLNRNLEGVIAVGNEFSSVEALWSQFEGVMGRDAEGDVEGREEVGDGGINAGDGDRDQGEGEGEGGGEKES